MSSNVQNLKTELSQGLIDLKVHASTLGIAADRERRVAGLRANASSELKKLRELKAAFEPEILRLAEIDLTPVKNTGANIDALSDAPKIIDALNRAIASQESIVSGTVDAGTLIDAPQPIDSAAVIHSQIEALADAVAELSN